MLGFVFCHGWGYDPSFWENLKPYFKDYQCIYWDLGYFGKGYQPLPEMSSSIQWVGIGHSLGFLKLLNASFPWHSLIGLQGFLNFTGFCPSLKRKRYRDLSKLKNYFEKNTNESLCNFHNLCGSKDMQASYQAMNKAILLQDLSLLETASPIKEDLSCLILGSEDDLIVTKELINDNFMQHNQVQIVMHNKGLHNLGFSEPEFIKDAIFTFLSNAQ